MYTGPGTTPSDKSKNCQLHLNLKYPGGFQFAVVESTYHGYAQLEEGVTGTFYSTYYFSQDAAATVSGFIPDLVLLEAYLRIRLRLEPRLTEVGSG